MSATSKPSAQAKPGCARMIRTLLPRPLHEFIGDNRQVMVLETDTQLYSLLTQEDYEALASNGVTFPRVLIDNKAEHQVRVVVGQHHGDQNALATFGFVATHQNFVGVGTLLEKLKRLQSAQPVNFTQLSSQHEKAMRDEMDPGSKTSALLRTASQKVTIAKDEGIETITLNMFRGATVLLSNTLLFEQLEVRSGERAGVIRTMVSSRVLTSTHMMALIEFGDGSFDFVNVRKLELTGRVATDDHFRTLCSTPLAERVKEHFADKFTHAKSLSGAKRDRPSRGGGKHSTPAHSTKKSLTEPAQESDTESAENTCSNCTDLVCACFTFACCSV